VLTGTYILLGGAVVCFVTGAIARLRKHEGTMWWRGSMGLLAFAIALILLQILFVLSSDRVVP